MNCLAAATFSIVKLEPNTSSSSSGRSSILSLSLCSPYPLFLTLESREYQVLSLGTHWRSSIFIATTRDDENMTSKTSFVFSSYLLLNRHSHATCSDRTFRSCSRQRGGAWLSGGNRSHEVAKQAITALCISLSGMLPPRREVGSRASKWECDALHVVASLSQFNDAFKSCTVHTLFSMWKKQRRPVELAVIGPCCPLAFNRLWIYAIPRVSLRWY